MGAQPRSVVIELLGVNASEKFDCVIHEMGNVIHPLVQKME